MSSYRARLVVICTDNGTHERTVLHEVVLDPVIDGGGRVSGVVTGAGRQQQSNGAPARHLGTTARGQQQLSRFACPRCPRVVVWNDATLRRRLYAVADAVGRGLLPEPTVDLDVSFVR